MLGYLKEEINIIEDKYKMPSKYTMDIIKNYGTMEAFVEAYKKCQCNYNFKNDIFCGFRGITISKNDITEYQKIQYALTIKDIFCIDISKLEYNTGKYLDIDEFENAIMSLTETEQKVYKYHSSLYGKKYTLTELGNMLGVSKQRVSQIIKSVKKTLNHLAKRKDIIGDYQNDYKEIMKYNSEINNLKSEIEELQIISNYFSNENYKYENIELTKLNIRKELQEKLNQENIFTIPELVAKYYSKINPLERKEIEDLELSVRAYHCLKQININTGLDLIKLSEEKLKNIQNLGEKTYYEIIKKKDEILKYGANQQDENTISNLEDFNVDSINNIDIIELAFSCRVFNCLRRNYIRTLCDLINLTKEDLLKVKNLGKNGMDEILNKLSSMGLGLKEKDDSSNFSNSKEILMIKYEYEKKIKILKKTLEYKIEEMEDIQNKKNIIEIKIKRYYKAIKQYLNKEYIFNSEYNIPAINLNKEDFENIDNIKTFLDDLHIVSNENEKKLEKNEVNPCDLEKNEENPYKDEKKIEEIKFNLKMERKKHNKSQEKIEWILQSDKNTFDKINKHIIENELNKIDMLETEYLILEPSKSIKGTIYIQVCIESFDEEYKGEKFYIELCYEDNKGNFISFGKDHLNKVAILKIFIDYFENNNIPDIEDWYVVEI